MVRSTNSCFKIITCGSDSAAEVDDLELNESRASTDKRGWSFRKRSERHRVLSNTVVSEIPSAGNKESPETTSIDFHAQTNTTVDLHAQTNSSSPEKISALQWTDETPPLAPVAPAESKASDAIPAIENDSGIGYYMQESVIIVIQTAIRGYLAQKELCKLKNLVKLQAAVRGHLVRRQAVGTLRCVQAIVKMQALVRARRVCQTLKGSPVQEKLEKIKTNNKRGKENSSTEANEVHSSTKKLLANGFARQLLELRPKTKPIHINCESPRSSSGWQWLERWMSASSVDVQPQKLHLNLDFQIQGEKTNTSVSDIETKVQSEIFLESPDLKSDVKETEKSLEGEKQFFTNDGDDFDFQAGQSTAVSGESSNSVFEYDLKPPQLDDTSLAKTGETLTKASKVLSETPDSVSNQIAGKSDAASVSPSDSVSYKPEFDRAKSRRTTKRLASEQLENEGKKSVFGSRKACNPAFAAVQSKFEELSSSVTSGRSINSTYRDVAVESRLDSPTIQVDSATRTKHLSLTEDSISPDPRIQIGGSECGTELSISSTLDSPERSETDGVDIVHEIRDKGFSDINSTDDNKLNSENLNAEAKYPSSISDSLPNLSYSDIQTGKIEFNGNSVADMDSTQSQQQPAEQSVLDTQIQLDVLTDQRTGRSSPEGSPRSQMTIPESHGTPSSQISVNAKRSKSDNSKPKRKSLSAGKKSPSNQGHDSGARKSIEQLPKEPKNGKRQSSFDHEPRVSSSNSLPSYMQATESARAKAHSSNSPKSSPDVHDKETYIKKRHSLPGANGKQGSPRMQRSTSQAQQNVKGNGTHSPHTERKWVR